MESTIPAVTAVSPDSTRVPLSTAEVILRSWSERAISVTIHALISQTTSIKVQGAGSAPSDEKGSGFGTLSIAQ
eukprot:10623396-Heterocapsa_arctica.AAC.1